MLSTGLLREVAGAKDLGLSIYVNAPKAGTRRRPRVKGNEEPT